MKFTSSLLAFPALSLAISCGGDASSTSDDISQVDSGEPRPSSSGGGSGSTGGTGATTGGVGEEPGTGGTNESPGSGSGGTNLEEAPDPAGTWRSRLYPRGWVSPDRGGSPDAFGQTLQDYSYAGYHRGEATPPYGATRTTTITIDVTLGNGTTNATHAIQTAIDDVCEAGGGVVQIPAGTFRIRLPSDSASEALLLHCSHIVLRGAGPSQTKLVFDDAKRARSKSAIAMRSSAGTVWDPKSGAKNHALLSDLPASSKKAALADASDLAVGDFITLRNDVTTAFRTEHRMDASHTGEGDYWPSNSFRGLYYVRTVEKIEGNTVHFDAPTRYTLKTRDNARLFECGDFISESGIESLSLGMVQNSTSSLSSGGEASHDEEYKTSGTTPYEVHASNAISVSLTRDSWLYDVDTFVPSQNNSSGVHVLSNGLLLASSAFRITVEKCDFGRPQYRGGGGNGYLFHIQGNDNLFRDSTTKNARHGYIFNQAVSGNVFLRGKSVSSRLSDDSHRFLAHANLYDQMDLDGSFLQAVNRGTTSTGGGYTATEHVFWNTHVTKNHGAAKGCAVESAQYGKGYLIGSSASVGSSANLCPDSFSNGYWATLDLGAPEDFVEGENEGATLYPVSLYANQLERRCARDGLSCL